MKHHELIPPFFLLGVKDFNFSSELRSALKEFPVGGLIFFNSPHDSPSNIWSQPESALEAVYEFISQAQALVPLLAIDQEGGRVRRLRPPFIPLPSAFQMGFMYQEGFRDELLKLWELAAKQIALSHIGLNFAPVCDLRYEEGHDVIGDRAFATNAEKVTEIAGHFVDIFERHGIRCILKHYPGHGPSRFDSHEQVALLFKSREELFSEDTKVFESLAQRASGLMTAHIAFEDDPETLFSLDGPSLEAARKSLGAEKLWVTDDLMTMKAVNQRKPWLRCLENNYDYLLLCDTLDKTLPAVEESIRWSESVSRPFADELAIENRLKYHAQCFKKMSALPKFKLWRDEILRCYDQGESLLEKIRPQLP